MRSKLACWILKLMGWTISGYYPNDENKNILIVVPHTSWVDFPIGVMVRSCKKLQTRFLAKKSLFKPPMGSFFRWMGGYPVDRSGNKRMVDAVIDVFNEKENFDIAIAPEGTRKKVTHLRTGFYWMAKGSGAAIVPVKFDYGNKNVHFGEPFYPGDDPQKDIEELEAYFRGIEGKIPENSF